jgi:catalase
MVEQSGLMDEIRKYVTALYSQLPFVVAVYCGKVYWRDLLFVHDEDNTSSAERKIFDRTRTLEERFPKIDFDYLVLHKNETNESNFAARTLLYSRRE